MSAIRPVAVDGKEGHNATPRSFNITYKLSDFVSMRGSYPLRKWLLVFGMNCYGAVTSSMAI
jgi:hypothetical protein